MRFGLRPSREFIAIVTLVAALIALTQGKARAQDLWHVADTSVPANQRPPIIDGNRMLWCGKYDANWAVTYGYPNHAYQFLYIDTGVHAGNYTFTVSYEFSSQFNHDYIYLIGGGSGAVDPIGAGCDTLSEIIATGQSGASQLLVRWTGSIRPTTAGATSINTVATSPIYVSDNTGPPSPLSASIVVAQEHRALYFVFVSDKAGSSEDGLWPEGHGQMLDDLATSDNGPIYTDQAAAGGVDAYSGSVLLGTPGAPIISTRGNNKPTAIPGPPAPYTGTTSSPVVLDGSASSDPDVGQTLTYSWTFGDGSTGSGVMPAHTYGKNGLYIVSLIVTDNGCPVLRDTSYTVAQIGPCADTAARMDSMGNVLFPPNVDPESIRYELMPRTREGFVDELNPEIDTSTTLYYGEDPCDPSIDTESLPGNVVYPAIDDSLEQMGIPGGGQAMADSITLWETEIAQMVAQEADSMTIGGAPAEPYTPPDPHVPTTPYCYVFGGRDLIFVHGLRNDPLFAKMNSFNSDHKAAQVGWVEPTSFPGWTDNPSFYNGYWKKGANEYWQNHIIRFLKEKKIKNRYLIVSWASTQRLSVGAKAILTQISDAMNHGIGVIDPSGRNDSLSFGTPSYVLISHSTGGLITDVAMAAAANNVNLGAQYISNHAKAHIALHGAFSGSSFAVAATVLFNALGAATPASFLCETVAEIFDNKWDCSYLSGFNFAAVNGSVMIDLIPLVSQQKWGSYENATPVRTLTVGGGHPSVLFPLKNIFHAGFDDGTLTLNSQFANPTPKTEWPSGIVPEDFWGYVQAWDRGLDMGVTDTRRLYNYFDQVLVDPTIAQLTPPFTERIAAGAVPWLTPTGMRVNRGDPTSPLSDALARYQKHFSFLQSPSEHFDSTPSFGDAFVDAKHPTRRDYRTTFGWPNLEETLVITNPAVFDNYSAGADVDVTPLLQKNHPRVVRWNSGYKVEFDVPLFWTVYHFRWWIWKREHDLIDGYEDKVECDYVYRNVLQAGGENDCYDITACTDLSGSLAQSVFVDGTMLGLNCNVGTVLAGHCWPGIRGSDIGGGRAIHDNFNSPLGDSITITLGSELRSNGMGINWHHGFDKSVNSGLTIAHTNPDFAVQYDEPRIIYRLFDPATKSWSPFDSSGLDVDNIEIQAGDTTLVGCGFRMDWPPRDKAGLSLPGGFTLNGRSDYNDLSFLPRGTRLQYYFKKVEVNGGTTYLFAVDGSAHEVEDLPPLPGSGIIAPDVIEFDILPRVYPPGPAGTLVAGRTDSPILVIDGAYTRWDYAKNATARILRTLGVRADRYRTLQGLYQGGHIGGHELAGSPAVLASNYFPNMDEYGIGDSLANWYRIVIEATHTSAAGIEEEADAKLMKQWWLSPTGTDGGDRCFFASGDDYFSSLLSPPSGSPNPNRRALVNEVFGVVTAPNQWNGGAAIQFPMISDQFADPAAGPALGSGGFQYPLDGGLPTLNRFDAMTKVGAASAQNTGTYPPFASATNVASIANVMERDGLVDHDRNKALGYGFSYQFVQQNGMYELNRQAQILFKFLASCRGARSGTDTSSCWPCPTGANKYTNWLNLNELQTGVYGPLYPVQDGTMVLTGVSESGPEAPRFANALSQNRPNPFNPVTVIQYSIATRGKVTIRIFDVSGRCIRTLVDKVQDPGVHQARWSGELSSGGMAASSIYFYRITYPDGRSSAKKMALLR